MFIDGQAKIQNMGKLNSSLWMCR